MAQLHSIDVIVPMF